MKICAFGGVLYAVVWSSVSSQAGLPSGYLRCTGPVPLRFAAETTGLDGCELPPLLMEDDAPASTNLVSPENNASALPGKPTVTVTATNSAESIAPDAMANQNQSIAAGFDGDPLAIPQPLSPPSTPASPEIATAASASDLLVVTPQMLVDYFKPSRATTNSAGTAIFVPLGFTPPAPMAVTPPSSSATYRTQ